MAGHNAHELANSNRKKIGAAFKNLPALNFLIAFLTKLFDDQDLNSEIVVFQNLSL